MNNIKSFYSLARQLQKSSANVRFCVTARFFHPGINENVENRLKKKDSVSKEFRIIYRAPILNYVRGTYGITFFSIVFITPYITANVLMQDFGVYPVMVGNSVLINNGYELLGFVAASIFVIAQISYTVFKYPYRIYHTSTSDKYIAVFQHILPWKVQKTEFHSGETMKILKSYSLWRKNLYQLKDRKAILLEDHFFIPEDLNKMLSIKENEGKQSVE